MPSEGFLRPEAIVLGEDSLVPPQNLIQPPPNRFTHELAGDEPFYFGTAEDAGSPNGSFPQGTRVVLLRHDGGSRCRVADGRGLHVEVGYSSLAEPRPETSPPGVAESPDPPLG